MPTYFDFLIVGSGIAGLIFALEASRRGKVLLVSKEKDILSGSSIYAQGGVAVPFGLFDSVESHIADTLRAGSFHNNELVVNFFLKNAERIVRKLITELEFDFDVDAAGNFLFGREGGHNASRILHSGDQTGLAMMQKLKARVLANTNLIFWPEAPVGDLLVHEGRCFGAKIFFHNTWRNIFARNTVLATGGLGQLFSATTNPYSATGDGLALGLRAGASVQDLEFLQFHPTALAPKPNSDPGEPLFLLSEALRGEGAKLVNGQGENFMGLRHSLGDLAPRDIVARAIYEEIYENGNASHGSVFLTFAGAFETRYLDKRFPSISAFLRCRGLSLAQDLLPIIPAMHYSCGGIKVGLNGETSLSGLFAYGELACTGLHGANRLASNSLLEALVSPVLAFENFDFLQKSFSVPRLDFPLQKKKVGLNSKSLFQFKCLVSEYLGIKRDREKIRRNFLPFLRAKINNDFFSDYVEGENFLIVACALTEAILSRSESLGCHYVV